MIQQMMDHDPGPGARDFTCGPMTYDGHSGTDIRAPDMEALAAGIPILAAAPGTILGTRNSVPDTGIGGFPEGQDCGNGVVIEHENGWQTQYCHMAQGSVLVRTGDVVAGGDPLGEMGFSGSTEFPHLHMTLRHGGQVVDPFAPTGTATCGEDATPLWAEPVPLAQGGILSVGFAQAVPEFDAIREGTADAATLTTDADAVVIWGFFHGGRAGDIVTATITAPDGTVFHTQEIALDATQAQLFRATGRRIREPIAPGQYTGTITLGREGVLLDSATTLISVN
ncbi:M23 family metallopeptidase [Gymnodinialimonas sp. 57CJ19]|uniref:M23 family metallopeptidase n=1 Tax=Gymnodinialimonas sp. 57CJ19 TaxID=3138498 RepID=UPI00313425E5